MPSGAWTTLQKIHTILFQDIYDFAGTLRTVNIAKGNFRFVPVMYHKRPSIGVRLIKSNICLLWNEVQ